MGSSTSIVAETLPDDIKALVDVIEGQKNRIAENDATILEKECAKMFKGHNVIIDELTARSKPQIARMIEKFPRSLAHLDSLIEGGNTYAKFIKQLAIPKEQIELDMVTRNGVEYDEEMLVDIIGTSSVKEIKAFDERFTKLKSYSLLDVFLAHGKKDSVLLKFVQRILRLDRDESKNVDRDLAVKQAEIIHKSGASRLIGVDEDPIIEIFASSSRVQCACIAECYMEHYNMKLERAINMKFKGNCGKLMVLWTEPVPNAILSAIGFFTSKMLVDTTLIAHFLAKYDKDTLSSVDEACMASHKKPLAEFIKHGILSSSTLHRACKGWIESPSPDKGFEKILQLFLDSKFPDGKIVLPNNNNSGNSERRSGTAPVVTPKGGVEDMTQKFKFLLEKQAQEIKLFMIDRKIKMDPNDQFVLSRSSTQQSSHPTPKSGSEAATGKLNSIASFSAKQKKLAGNGGDDGEVMTQIEEEEADVLTPLVSPRRNNPKPNEKPMVAREGSKTIFGTNYVMPTKPKSVEIREQQSKEVYNYLQKYYERKDTESDGSFEGGDFWRYTRGLPLEEFGMNDDDIDTIRQYCTWENEDDGRVYYYEVLFELTESVITAIETKTTGETDPLKVIARLAAIDPPITPHRDQIKSSAKKTSTPNGVISRQFSVISGIGSGVASPRFNESFVLSEKRKEQAVSKFPKMPFYLREYIMDTLNAFDFDVNGTLCRTELENVVPALNIPSLTVEEFFKTAVEVEKDRVLPKDVADIISAHIHDWFGDGEDHYICLVDKGSGAYFWYNTRDESTQWADNSYYNAEGFMDGSSYTAASEGEYKTAEVAATGIAFSGAELEQQEEEEKDPSKSSTSESKPGSSVNLIAEMKSESKLEIAVSEKKPGSPRAETESKKMNEADSKVDESGSVKKSPRSIDDVKALSKDETGPTSVKKSPRASMEEKANTSTKSASSPRASSPRANEESKSSKDLLTKSKSEKVAEDVTTAENEGISGETQSMKKSSTSTTLPKDENNRVPSQKLAVSLSSPELISNPEKSSGDLHESAE